MGQMTEEGKICDLQIERLVRRGTLQQIADFNSPFAWWICSAMIPIGMENKATIQTRSTPMTLEQANMVAVGLRLAIKWIKEQQAMVVAGPSSECCSDCHEILGEQHRPSCHRQGLVTVASVYWT